MSEGFNQVIFLGNLGADPELRHTQGGDAVLNMRIAASKSYLDKNKVKQERTTWMNATLWGARGEALGKFLTKGSKVMVTGELRNSDYEKDGVKHYKTEINVNEIVLCGGKRDGASDETDDAPATNTRANGRAATPTDDDSIPF